jgi:hypothetical protein
MSAEKMWVHVIHILRPVSMKLVATDVNLLQVLSEMKVEPHI